MIGRQVIVATLLASALVGTARAQSDVPEAAKRRQTARHIRALTDCVANRSLSDDEAPQAFRGGTFSTYAVRIIGRCQDAVNELVNVYDPLYGEGQTIVFLNGPYAADLPRAILKRIRPQLEAKVAMLQRQEADQAAREAQDKVAEEAKQKANEIAAKEGERRQEVEQERLAAEAEQQVAIARAAATKAEAEAKTAAVKAEAEQLQRIEVAKGAVGLLVGRAAECARLQLGNLVKSGESAEVLATAVMTICSDQVGQVLDAGLNEFKMEHEDSTSIGDGLIRERLKADTREQIVTLAVQAKAGVGTFAPASNAN